MSTIEKIGERRAGPDRRCGYIAYHRAPRCERHATAHALVDLGDDQQIKAATCDQHRSALQTLGWIRDMHTFGPGCAHPVTKWDRDGCLPGM